MARLRVRGGVLAIARRCLWAGQRSRLNGIDTIIDAFDWFQGVLNSATALGLAFGLVVIAVFGVVSLLDRIRG